MDKSARILVVDDNESVRKILETVLEYVGYAVDTAKTGEEALKKAKAKIYNLAIVDYSLLDMELLVFLKRSERMAPTTQIIVVADKPSLPKVKEKIGRKPYPCLLKPFEMETLLTIIRRQLRKQRWKKRSRKIATGFVKPLEKHL
jgi:DNA-binding NtrC family response regulator